MTPLTTGCEFGVPEDPNPPVCGLRPFPFPGVTVDGRRALPAPVAPTPPLVVVIAGRVADGPFGVEAVRGVDVVIGPFAVGVVRGVDVVIGAVRDTGADVLGVLEDCGAVLVCGCACCCGAGRAAGAGAGAGRGGGGGAGRAGGGGGFFFGGVVWASKPTVPNNNNPTASLPM